MLPKKLTLTGPAINGIAARGAPRGVIDPWPYRIMRRLQRAVRLCERRGQPGCVDDTVPPIVPDAMRTGSAMSVTMTSKVCLPSNASASVASVASVTAWPR